MPLECPSNFLCSSSDITEIICSWNSKMSAGPDGIPIQILKPLASFIAPSLSALFNKSISECALPQEWKLANVTPIPKSNRMSEETNYRPISLLSVTSKICEKFVSSILFDHLDEHNILSDSQWGFREGRSTCNALLDITHTWHCHLNDGKEVAIVFFDYAKAFDSIPHAPLLSVLSNIGLHHHIIQWLSAYLTNRRQRVIVNDSFSTPAHASSGVPQGSIIGPILFDIYINDITTLQLSPNTKLTLFADDMSLTKEIQSVTDISILQNDIDSISTWSQRRFLKFNIGKCKFMLLTNRRNSTIVPSPSLTLGNVALEQVYQYKYLGILISEDLKWDKHIDHICSKACKLVGMIYRNLYQYSSPSFLLMLYKSIVRPHLEYCSALWDPHQSYLNNRLQSVEKFALRVCLKAWGSSYENLLVSADLPPLEVRRNRNKLLFVYKVLYKLTNMPNHLFTPLTSRKSVRFNHSLSLTPYTSNTNRFMYSAIPSMIKLWNALPFNPSECTSIAHFKYMLSNHHQL